MVDRGIGKIFGGMGVLIVCVTCIPLLIINLVSTGFLVNYYNSTNLAIWLAVNTAFSLTICVIVIGLTIYVCIMDLDNVEVIIVSIWCVPMVIFILKIAFNIWGAVVLFSYSITWNPLSKMSLAVLIIQWIVYFAMLLIGIIAFVRIKRLR